MDKTSRIIEMARKFVANKDSLSEEEYQELRFAPASWRLIRACPEVIGLNAADLDSDWLRKYVTCRVCGKRVNVGLARHYLRQYQEAKCGSQECNVKDLVERHGCCDKAKPLSRYCTCMYAFECPEHGEKHIGTHD